MKERIILILVSILFLSSFESVSVYGAISASEREALVALYTNTNGDSWNNNSGWKDGTLEADGFGPIGSENTWYGITVSGDHVTSIDLSWNVLNGSLPPELGNLNSLQSLILHANQLSGSIPPELGNLNNLVKLLLASNHLSGSIPVALGNLSKLEQLAIFYNQLNGTIPIELANLSNLKELYLSSNQLTGSIPPELGNLSNLKELSLLDNSLTGSIPVGLANLSNLSLMLLDDNQLTGSIPPEFGNLSSLTILSLGHNQLSGSIPPELGNLENLHELHINDTSLTGSIPEELGNLSNLGALYLSGNQLTGNIPPALGNLTKLVNLYLAENQLTGSIPKELANLSNLSGFWLNENQLSNSIPSELGNLSNLEYLYLSHNHLTGNIPSTFGKLTKLRVLSLGGNKLTGSITTCLMNLTNLDDWAIDIAYNGLYTDNDTLKAFLNIYGPGWEDSQTIAPANIVAISTSSTSIKISWNPITFIEVTGGYMVYYSEISGGPWTYAGMTSNKTGSFFEVKGLKPDTRYYFIVQTKTDPHLFNSNTVISEESDEVYSVNNPSGPFGEFASPVDGSIVRSSIPVTGWALDDFGVESVKIYREEGKKLAYIGDAVFVEGARPDIELTFPGYPNNHKAGWGYMMLTYFLPNGGNGTFRIHAIARDIDGNEVILGVKTITCDNANAVKPFGAIDTPTQGGTASGNSYRNNGWALTPMPNMILTDGSTIDVYVDSVYLGHTKYNLFREDISSLFPGYANSDSAWAYFDLNTTNYNNGVHQIYWIATDDVGNSDGIGSRYFSILNECNFQRARGMGWLAEVLSEQFVNYLEPIQIKKGYERNIEPQKMYPDDKGCITIEISELDRIEIYLDAIQIESYNFREVSQSPLACNKNYFNSKFSTLKSTSFDNYIGCMLIGNQLKPLPIGSTLDVRRGIFYWQSGPGFIGKYHLVFFKQEKSGVMSRRDIIIKIDPKFR